MSSVATSQKEPTTRQLTASPSTLPSKPSDVTDVAGKEEGAGDVLVRDEPQLGRWGVFFAALIWGAILLLIALANDTSRAFILANLLWEIPLLVLTVFGVAIALLRGWLKGRSASAQAAALMLVGYPLVGLAVGGTFFFLPVQWQLVTIRSIVLLILVLTPVLLWWLFLAAQRASLLNEFLANLQRLGLLNRDAVESQSARATRISSYLQRFEGSYGRLPEEVHDDVLSHDFRPYSRDETKLQTSFTAAAVPVSLTFVLLTVGWLLVLPPIDSFPESPLEPRWLLALSPNITPATAAFLGAYFFSLQMLFRRYVRSDLRGSAYVAVVIRIVLAVIGVLLIQAIGETAGWVSEDQLLVLAFVIGVFPVVFWQVIRSMMSKVFRLAVPSLESRMPLNRLDGLTVWHESRLEEEDIENVQNMATADLVDLLVSTRLPAGRIVDWVDQAILLTQLGPDEANNDRDDSARRRLAAHGVRTASALLKTVADMDYKTRKSFATVLKDRDGKPAIPSLLSVLPTNTNLACVLRWRGLSRLLSTAEAAN